MTRNEKKTAIENMAERFMRISDLEGKSMAIMVMSAYAEGNQGNCVCYVYGHKRHNELSHGYGEHSDRWKT